MYPRDFPKLRLKNALKRDIKDFSLDLKNAPNYQNNLSSDSTFCTVENFRGHQHNFDKLKRW